MLLLFGARTAFAFPARKNIVEEAMLKNGRDEPLSPEQISSLISDIPINAIRIDCAGEIIYSQDKFDELHTIAHQGRAYKDGDQTAYLPGLGTVRPCRICACLVNGGPTICLRCAKEVED